MVSVNRRTSKFYHRANFKADNARIIPPCSAAVVKYAVGSIIAVTAFMLSLEMIGITNFIGFYEPADPSDPAAVTVKGVTVSLLSGENNLYNALGSNYQSSGSCEVWGILVSEPIGYNPSFAYEYKGYEVYYLDIFGQYPDDCYIYNGINSCSTPEELEAAFGDDCIRTENSYVEVFIDGKEADYEKISLPSEDEKWSDWFESLCSEYPCEESCVVLECRSYSKSTDITFIVWENT